VRIHRLRRYASVVLAAFIGTFCVTVLAPVAEQSGYQLVCSAAGSKLIATGAGGHVSGPSPLSDPHADGAAHCPLCLPVSPPPTAIAWVSAEPLRFSPVESGFVSAEFDSAVGAPLPARGPPVLS
jgi:hypothetical protein